MVPGILIGTAILWGLTLLVVQPIARAWAEQDGALQTVPDGQAGSGVEIQDEIPMRYFIATDIAVLAAAGLVIGLVFGYFFIGLAWGWARWPGPLAFIAASFVGVALHGPA